MKNKVGETGIGREVLSITPEVQIGDTGRMTKKWTITKFEDEAARDMNAPYEISEFEDNVFLNEGINTLWTLVCSAGGTRFDSANAWIGVGDSAVAESAAHTGLQAATNRLYKAMMGGFPTFGTLQRATWRSEFTGPEANFAWNEFTVANGNSDAAMNLNRRVSAQGTKIAGQVWQLTLEITLT